MWPGLEFRRALFRSSSSPIVRTAGNSGCRRAVGSACEQSATTIAAAPCRTSDARHAGRTSVASGDVTMTEIDWSSGFAVSGNLPRSVERHDEQLAFAAEHEIEGFGPGDRGAAHAAREAAAIVMVG